MNYTLDTDAIRKRFAEAIVGIRADGSMAVLVETIASNWFDIVDGGSYNEPMVRDLFTALIRPRDRCEGTNYPPFERPHTVTGMFCGFSGDCQRPFIVRNDGVLEENYAIIRPLPEPVAEANPDLEQARARIENAERELSEARAALERASK